MLTRLTIENVALIDSAELLFSEGLNVLSGETGAGKSVILDSIDFVLGAKADKSMIRFGKDFCTVRAEFGIGGNAAASEALGELDIEAEDTLVISRKLTLDGKSSLKLNGCTVTAAMLRRVTGTLVDVHGQSEHFYLLKESNQLKLLDNIGGGSVADARACVSELVTARKNILSELKLIGGDEGERDRRLDILRFQIDEIEKAAIYEGEEEELKALRTRYLNAEKILTALNAARDYLLADGGCLDALTGARKNLNSLIKFDEKYGALAERLERAAEEISDVSAEAEEFASELDVDEAEAERAEERLDEIKSLKKKYGGSLAEINAFLERAKAEYERLKDSGARYEKLQIDLNKTEDLLYNACLQLTKARKEAAKGFTSRVTDELKTLNISSARFEVEFSPYGREDAAKATADGLDRIRFLFSANAGEPLKELSKIISGGEMSRFMLSVKAQLSTLGDIGTYLFDEIDAGISGKTARVVAEKFCKISRHTQIIAVSHLAQIAAFADRQLLIEKSEEDGKTHTRVRELSGQERIAEISRLLGGETESEYAAKHAEELLENARIYKNSL